MQRKATIEVVTMPNRPLTCAPRMERQHLARKAGETDYIRLCRDMQPGQIVYWNGFGNPPSLSYHWHLDVTFREDDNHTIDKQAAFSLNIIRKLALNVLKVFDTGKSLSLRMKRFIIQP